MLPQIRQEESLYPSEVDEELEEQSSQNYSSHEDKQSEEKAPEYQRKVNKAVSFNAIKNHVFNLFYCVAMGLIPHRLR